MRYTKYADRVVARHVITWCCIVVFVKLIDPIPVRNIWAYSAVSLMLWGKHILAYYFVSLYLLPMSWKVNYPLFLFLCLFSYAIYYGADYTTYHLLYPFFDIRSPVREYPARKIVADTFFQYSLVFLCATSFYLNRLHIRNLKLQNEREKLLLLKELSFFKNHFNEHITFNFLNYCYSHIHNYSKEAARAIELFSDMLRYTMNTRPDEKVPLKEEITYIHNFIRLKKILNAAVYVNYLYPKPLPSHFILPRMLVTFIENAFKHGVYNDPESPVTILLKIEKGRLEFYVKNAIVPKLTTGKPGIGLENVRQMLEYYYSDHYRLDLRSDNGQFICNLNIDLDYELTGSQQNEAPYRPTKNSRGNRQLSEPNLTAKPPSHV